MALVDNNSSEMDKTIPRFFFLAPPGFFRPLDDETNQQIGPSQEAAMVFRGNLEAALNVASIPFLMANAAAHGQMLHTMHMAERIRSLKHDPSNDGLTNADLDRRAWVVANERFQEERGKEGTAKVLADDTLRRLEEALVDESFNRAASELLAETLVMLWGALEAFVSEMIRAALNNNPKAAAALVVAEPAKKHFPKGVSVEALSGFGFNVGQSMGDLLLGDRNLDALPMIKDILSAMAPGDAELHRKWGDSRLWKLWQRRHLVVHRRGLVDAPYIAKTLDTLPIGSRLQVSSSDVDETAVIIRDAAIELLRAFRILGAPNGGQAFPTTQGVTHVSGTP